MLRFSSGTLFSDCPLTFISPELGNSYPPIIRKVVVFPQPLGPITNKNSPSYKLKEIFLTAISLPNALVRSLTSNTTFFSSMLIFSHQSKTPVKYQNPNGLIISKIHPIPLKHNHITHTRRLRCRQTHIKQAEQPKKPAPLVFHQQSVTATRYELRRTSLSQYSTMLSQSAKYASYG